MFLYYRKNYYKEGDYIYPKFDAVEAYRRALKTWASWIDEHLNQKKLVFYRGYSSAHFRYTYKRSFMISFNFILIIECSKFFRAFVNLSSIVFPFLVLHLYSLEVGSWYIAI